MWSYLLTQPLQSFNMIKFIYKKKINGRIVKSILPLDEELFELIGEEII